MLWSKLNRNIPEFQKLILSEGFVDSINVFVANKETPDVLRLIANIGFYVLPNQLDNKISDKIAKVLIFMLDKTQDELFYTALKALRRNLRLIHSSTVLKITEKLFSSWR